MRHRSQLTYDTSHYLDPSFRIIDKVQPHLSQYLFICLAYKYQKKDTHFFQLKIYGKVQDTQKFNRQCQIDGRPILYSFSILSHSFVSGLSQLLKHFRALLGDS